MLAPPAVSLIRATTHLRRAGDAIHAAADLRDACRPEMWGVRIHEQQIVDLVTERLSNAEIGGGNS